MSYHLTIRGLTWGGFKSTHTYGITEAQAQAIKTGQGQPGKLAGDFQEVTAWELFKITVEGAKGPGWASSTKTKMRLASKGWPRSVCWEGRDNG